MLNRYIEEKNDIFDISIRYRYRDIGAVHISISSIFQKINIDPSLICTVEVYTVQYIPCHISTPDDHQISCDKASVTRYFLHPPSPPCTPLHVSTHSAY